MKNVWKKITMTAILTAMLLTMAACGGSNPSTAKPSSLPETSASEPVASPEAEADTAEVTEESYKAEIKRIYETITEKSAALSGIDATDAAKAGESMKAVIAELTPLYEEMAALTAPEALAENHANIADGATASVDILKLSNQMFDIAAGTAEGDPAQLTADIQAKIAELTPKATAFAEALQKVLA